MNNDLVTINGIKLSRRVSQAQWTHKATKANFVLLANENVIAIDPLFAVPIYLSEQYCYFKTFYLQLRTTATLCLLCRLMSLLSKDETRRDDSISYIVFKSLFIYRNNGPSAFA